MARIQTPQRIRGTQDIAFEDERRFARVLEAFDRVRRLFCYQRIEVPIFEATAVFARSLGETTDVVSKEMYTFEDRGGDSLTLRPEFTAGIARAYIGNGWQQHAPMKLATSGPAFRYERPQKGRFRQFHQLDVEIIGAAEPSADVDVILFAWQLLNELGIADGAVLRLNTLGDAASREAWRAGLIAHFEQHRGALSRESLDRLERNPLRILDSKEACDRPAADSAPTIDAYLSDEARTFFADVSRRLDVLGVPWERDARLVRGLDYYRHTAFVFVTDRRGAQGQLVGGGRYDGLIESMGGPPTPAVGWGCGLERLAMMIDEPAVERLDVAIAVEDDRASADAYRALNVLRHAGLASEIVAAGSPRKRYDKAARMSAEVIISFGHDGSASIASLRSVERSMTHDRVQAVLDELKA